MALPISDQVPSVSAAGQSPQPTVGSKVIKRKKAVKKTGGKPAPHGIPTSGERLAAWLANPGLRSKLPDSALTPELLKARQANQYNAAAAAPGSSYTNKQLDALVSMLAQQKYGQGELALQQQGQALANRATQEIPAWFQAYRDQVAAARAQQQQAAAQQVASLQQMATQAAGDTGGLAGAPMDAAGAARAQAAAAIRSAGIGNQAALAQNLAGNQNAYLQNLGLLSNGQQQAALQDVGTKQNALAQQVAQLAQDKGAFKTTQRQQILSDEADQALKNALTSAQIGSTTANTAATQASTTKTKAETKKTQAEQDYFDKHGYYPGKKPAAEKPYSSGPFAGLTPSQVKKLPDAKKSQMRTDYKKSNSTTDKDQYGNTSRQRQAATDAFTKAMTYAQSAVKDKKHGPSLVGDWKALANALVVGFNVNPAMARAAAQQVVLGHVGPNTAKSLKRRGVTLPKQTQKAIVTQTDQALSSVGDAVGSIGQ